MIDYRTWGEHLIEQGAKTQMETAASLPVALAGALMPDAHLGYGLPIGGVLGLDNAVCPYAVGVDIACRMKLSILPMQAVELATGHDAFCEVLEDNSYFGVGVERENDNLHDVLQANWGITDITKENQAKARRQLGTSGSGNHFIEFGIIDVPASDEQWTIGYSDPGPRNIYLGDIKAGRYVALMSHSGSRGTGATVADHYTKVAKALRPEFGELAWLELGTKEGDEYWAAMNLMGEYASANHDVIHREIAKALGVEPLFQIENHHNFAWKEVHHGREMIVHRKGATPAGEGVLGVIPGSMGTPAYVVRGLGNEGSLNSASHGAGRQLSRKAAKKAFNYRQEIDKLKEQGVTVLSAGADELVGAYKNIDEVMAVQSDLVEKVAKFEPRIVKMCGGKDRAEV